MAGGYFEGMMSAALKPKAELAQHPDVFYQGLQLCGIDGSRFSVTNTPQIKKRMSKARSRRGRAAFPKVGMAVLVELGLHNPLATALGPNGESEMVLAKRLVPILNIVAQIVWCVRITRARGKSLWVAFFLILPFTSIIAFLYLAFSDGAESDDDKRIEIMSLETT